MTAEESTFTVTDTVSTETTPETLTPDEQSSLEVGEKIAEESEQLLAGKYKTAEDLEKAYTELESKLGSQDKEPDQEAPERIIDEEIGDVENPYNEDGSINMESVNGVYGEQLANLFQSNKIDPWTISKHFHANNGEITDQMYGQLESAGLSRAAIDAYLDGRAVQSGYRDQGTSEDLSESDVNSIKNSVGGDEQYAQLTQWASSNLDPNVVEAFDNLLDSGNAGAIQLAVNGLKSQYEEATGYEGRMLTGKAAKSSGDAFRSQPELVAAMNDPRYENDPAYRQDVIEKLDRSDLQF